MVITQNPVLHLQKCPRKKPLFQSWHPTAYHECPSVNLDKPKAFRKIKGDGQTRLELGYLATLRRSVFWQFKISQRWCITSSGWCNDRWWYRSTVQLGKVPTGSAKYKGLMQEFPYHPNNKSLTLMQNQQVYFIFYTKYLCYFKSRKTALFIFL